MGVELTGKTLGLIGCGNIGSIVADRAHGMKMRVVAADPFLSEERAEKMGVEKVELDELYSRADFITLHTPLTDKTRNLIGKASLAKMKDGVRIVNCARGGLIVEADLAEALKAAKLLVQPSMFSRLNPRKTACCSACRMCLHPASGCGDDAKRRRTSRSRWPSRCRLI